MENPYTENKISKNTFIREFSQAIPSNEMVWHRDEEDRYITCINECNWKIQLDNELPKSITKNTFIPKETYHRIIKGNGNLIIRIIKK